IPLSATKKLGSLSGACNCSCSASTADASVTLSLLFPSNGCKNRGTSPSWVVASARIHCGAFLPMIARIAIGDRDHTRLALSRLACLIYPTDGKRGRVHMHVMGTHAKALARLGGNTSEHLRGILRVQPVQRPIQTIIIEFRCLYSWSEQVFHRFVVKELWHQVQ